MTAYTPAIKFTTGGCLEIANKMKDAVYLADPILVRGQVGTLTAQPNHGKTTFMIGLIFAAALGRKFGPIVTHVPDGDLIYIVSAEDLDGTRDRIFAEVNRVAETAEDRAYLDARVRWIQPDGWVTAKEIADEILADCAPRSELETPTPIALVYVDTGPALFQGADENSNAELTAYILSWRLVASLPGSPCVVISWHPTKRAGADTLLPRGASSILGNVGFNLTLWKDDTDRVTISYNKLRARSFSPIDGAIGVVKMDPPVGSDAAAPFFAPVITFGETSDKSERNDARQAREAILKPMYRANGNPPSVRKLAAETGISIGAISRHLQHLASARTPLVVKDVISDQYELTKAGAERAKQLVEQEARSFRDARDPAY